MDPFKAWSKGRDGVIKGD